jgi:hypothetical protein
MRLFTKLFFIYSLVSIFALSDTTISNAQTRASYIFTASATATSITATLKGVPALSTDLSDISIFIQDTPFALPNKPSISNNLLFNPKKETVAKDIVWSANIGSVNEYIRNGSKYYIRAEGAGYFSQPVTLNIPISYEKLTFGEPSSDCKSFSIISKLNNALPTDFEVKLKYATSIDAPEFKEAEPLNGTGGNMNKGIAEDGSYIYKLEGLSTATQYFVYQTIKSNKTGETINTPKENFNSCVGYIAAGTTAASDRYNQRSYRLLSDLSGKSIIPDYDLCIEEVAAKKKPEGSCNNQIGDYLNIMIKVLIGASAAWLVLQIVLKGYQYMVTDTPFKKTAAKERILESFGGLLLALSAYLILNTINPQLVTGTLNVGNIDIGVEETPDSGPAGTVRGPYTPIPGLLEAPGTQKRNADGYVRMPKAPNNEYEFWSATPDSQRCGSAELINSIYTVAINWSQKHPEERMVIGDINTTGHLSHKYGVDVDIFTKSSTNKMTEGGVFISSQQKAIEMGKMFADLGTVKEIYYDDAPVLPPVNQYARAKNADIYSVHGKGEFMFFQKNHYNHFHVRLQNKFKGPYATSCQNI